MAKKLNVVSIRLVKDAPLMSDTPICNPEDAVKLLGEHMCQLDREVLCIVNLKASGIPINCNFISVGAVDQTLAHPREIFKSCILSNAASVLLLHNHPSGKLTPSKEDSMLTDLFKAIDECEAQRDKTDNCENEKDSISNEMSLGEKIDTSQLRAIIHGILVHAPLLTTEIRNKVAEWEKQIFTSEKEYNVVLEQAKNILEGIRVADRLYLQDLQNSLDRVERNMTRRVVQSKRYPFLCDIEEPRSEQETVFFLLRILENSEIIEETQELKLDRVFDYDTSKGLDFIGVTTESEAEYREHIDSILNCSEYLDKKKIYETFRLLFDYRYSGVEIKLKIENGMRVGHSLTTARFLVAWSTTIGTDGCINAEDGKYDKVQEERGVYIYENRSTKHRIKVLILKEWGEKNGVFKVGNKSHK